MNPIDSGRITRTYTQRIEASPERVFPLICPVREAEWLDGWSDAYEMIHSDSGVAEEGCVFRTNTPGRPETIWMITRHDPAARIVEFFRVTAGLVATRLTIGVSAAPDAASSVNIRYTFTPLSASGADFVRATHSEEAFRRDMAFWEESMNHWLRTGEILRAPAR
jgi:hypothetical protein